MKKAFTLIELVMVIAILAILSTLAVSKVGGMKEPAARKVSLANQKSVERGVSAFLLANDGGLNRLDSLVYATASDRPDAGEEGFDFRSSDLLYRGPTDDRSEDVRERNSGLCDELLDVLAVYRLSEAEARALRHLGLRHVAQFTAYARERPAAMYTSDSRTANADGSVPLATDGLDPLTACCILRTVTNEMAVAAITPLNNKGRLVYRACGSGLLVTNESATASLTERLYDEETSKAEVAATGGAVVAFGLGDDASVVGHANAGLDAAPYATFAMKKNYSRYLLLFRLRPSAAASFVAEFAGVLDCEGNTVRTARDTAK